MPAVLTTHVFPWRGPGSLILNDYHTHTHHDVLVLVIVKHAGA